jgi:hypothetical protein
MAGWWKRKWEFVIVPEHSNAVVAIFSTLLFAATTLYTVFAALQWCANKKAADAAFRAAITANSTLGEIQKQNTLIKQQLIGTMSAIMTFQEPRLTPDEFSGQYLVVALLNKGHVVSPEVGLRFQVNRVSFPSLKPLWESRIHTESANQIGDGWSQRYSLSEFWPDFSSREQQAATQTKTITVRGTFKFDNGFGDKFQQEFCFSYLGSYNVKNEEGRGSTSGGAGFLYCDGFGEKVSYILKHQVH